MKQAIITIAVVALSACGLVNNPPTVVCAGQHSWENYHLPHDSLSPVVENASSYSVDAEGWNGLDSPITLRVGGQGFPIAVRDGGDDNSGWLGIARVAVGPGGHIKYAEVAMNRTLLDGYPEVVARHVMCQELGHLLGLDHQRGSLLDTCMDDCHGRSNAGWLECMTSEAATTPNAHDAEQLRDIYAHVLDPGSNPPDPAPPLCIGMVTVHAFEVPK